MKLDSPGIFSYLLGPNPFDMKNYAQSLLILLFSALTYMANAQAEDEPQIYIDYELGLEAAKEKNKPIFLLFTGKSCENNGKIQELIDANQAVEELLNEKFILIFLYVDDKTKLEEPYPVKIKEGMTVVKTLGQKWGTLQSNKYDTNFQPAVYVIDPDEQIISGPKKYPSLINAFFYYLLECEIVYQQKKY